MDDTTTSGPPIHIRRPSFFAKDRTWLNILLFVLTIGSTFLVGMTWSASFLYSQAPLPEGAAPPNPLRDPQALFAP